MRKSIFYKTPKGVHTEDALRIYHIAFNSHITKSIFINYVRHLVCICDKTERSVSIRDGTSTAVKAGRGEHIAKWLEPLTADQEATGPNPPSYCTFLWMKANVLFY